MKTNSLFSVLFILGVCLTGNAQYYVDMNISPGTPVPMKYTLEHFNLKGPVMEMDDSYAVSKFNESGKLISEKSIYGLDDKYIYDNYGELIRKETDLYGTKMIDNIIRDGGNRIIEASSKNNVGDKFTYDSSGNYYEKFNIVDNTVTERHFYDNGARIIKSEFFYPSLKESAIKTYSYKKDGDYLIIESTYTSSNPEKKPSYYKTYYKNGNYYGKTKNNNLQYDSYGNPLSYLDENGNVSKAIKYKYYDGSSSSNNNTTDNSNVKKPQGPPSSISSSNCESGDCINGWGKYVYDKGYYQGFWMNGKKHGYGLYQWEGEGKYIGSWDNDSMKGYGVYIAENNDNIIGNYYNGNLEGLGLTVIGETWTYGEFSKGSLSTNYTFYSNNVDTGCVAGDCQNKYGRWKWSNGDVYSGFFKNGKLLMGTYNFKNGDRYTGTFNSDNQFHGMGRYFYEAGGYYGGEWRNGNMHGRGYYHNASFEQQIGEWTNGTLTKSLKN